MNEATIIIGTAKSGTRYLSRYLTACGLDVGHERWGADGISAWELATIALPGGPRRLYIRRSPLARELSGATIIHLVRNPLAVVSSWLLAHPRSVRFASEVLSEVDDVEQIPDPADSSSLIRFAMRYWIEWNRLCHEVATLRIPVENFTDFPEQTHSGLIEQCGLPAETPVPTLRPNINSWQRRPGYRRLRLAELTAADPVLARDLFREADRYGYRVDREAANA